jgi:hypothetical protein
MLPKRIRAEMMNETGELKAARGRIREPGAALAGAGGLTGGGKTGNMGE